MDKASLLVVCLSFFLFGIVFRDNVDYIFPDEIATERTDITFICSDDEEPDISASLPEFLSLSCCLSISLFK